MKRTIVFFLALLTFNVFGQSDPTEKGLAIVAEGKMLYKLEMASWLGTDLFIDNYKHLENIGGYFSYLDKDISTCVFFTNSDSPKVIGTLVFDSTYSEKTAKIDLSERDFTDNEKDIYDLREMAYAEIKSDTLFKMFQNTSLNLIPIITEKEKKVYILTGPKLDDVVIFGNDYLLTYNLNNTLILKKKLHQNLIPIYYKDGENVEGSVHNHSIETGDFITATDICTLMLYEKFAKWKTHTVISEKYINIWNCETDQLVVVAIKDWDKIKKDQNKRNKKKDN